MTVLAPLPPTASGEQLYVAPPGPKPIRRVLIANRGEIALRIIRTCQQVHVETVAVYVDVDAASPYVSAATTAVHIGRIATAAVNPYMDGELLIRTALENDCDAIHPGYGYLSENADFVDAITANAHLRFIGPRGAVMREIGEKSRSKQLLRKAFGKDAPLVPGYDGDDQSDATLYARALEIGFPLMIKASFGGGGRGMRIVREAASLQEEISRARSEAQRNFGSPILLMERYIQGGKHIEVQIFGDAYGNVVALGERECSVQRRHQKIIEESPAVDFERDAELRARLHASAIAIGKLLSYQGAGTVEYIFDPLARIFSFLEVNTRLQVEHPITEMCTGLDLVALQLYVAGSGDLTKLDMVANVRTHGHAIELRLCAEEPGADFAPRTGTVRLLSVPMLGGAHGVRFDTGIRSGSQVSIHFDAMLGKLIVHADTRAACIQRAQAVLQTSVVIGLPTNTTFMQACLSHADFQSGEYSTALIPTNLEQLLAHQNPRVTSALSPKTTDIPVGAVLPAFHLFQSVRRSLNPSRQGLRSGFRMAQQNDLAFRQIESYSITTPDGGPSWELMLAYDGSQAESDAAAMDIDVWHNKAVTSADQAAKKIADAAGSRAKKEKVAAMQRAARTTAFYYGALLTRDGHEGRKQGEWAWGTKEQDVHRARSSLVHSHVAVHQPDKTAFAPEPWQQQSSKSARDSWITATIKVDIDGRTSTSVLATDGTFQQHETDAQTAWLWSPAASGPIKVVRRSMRVLFAEAQAAEADGAAAKGDYVTPMPARVLQILTKPGTVVEAGQAILICESMKIETTVRASTAGVVNIMVNAGDTVAEGHVLCSVGAAPADEQQQQQVEA